MSTAGTLRHQITIEQPVDASDGAGGKSRTWATNFKAFADIKPVSASLKFMAEKVESDISHVLTIRYRRDVVLTTQMRVNYTVGTTTRYFRIHGITNENERNQFYKLICAEGPGR